MIRNFFFSSVTAFSLVSLAACGDDGKGSDTNVQQTDGTTDTTNNTTEPGTTDSTEGTGTSITGDNPTTSTSTSEPPNPTATESNTATEPGTTTEEPGTTTEEPGTTTEDTTSTTSTTTTNDATTDDALQQCLDQVNPGDPCGECACTECLDELQACSADPGCKAIRDCAQEAGCGGIDCLGPCGDVIQMNGGPFGMSGMKAQAIGTCVDNQCQGQC